MPVLRIQENIKKEDGTYDAVHKETEASLVLFDDNKTFQQKYDAGELTGPNGMSAYQQAVEGGYTGTEAEFYAALALLKNGPFLPLNGGRMDDDVEIRLNNGILTAPPIGYGAAGLSCKDPNGGFARFWIGEPREGSNAATKKYVDDSIAAIPSSINLPHDGELVLVSVKYCTTNVGPQDFYNRSQLIPAFIDRSGTVSRITLETLSPVIMTRNDFVDFSHLIVRIIGGYGFEQILTDDNNNENLLPVFYSYSEMSGEGLLNQRMAPAEVVKQDDYTWPHTIAGDIKIFLGNTYVGSDGKHQLSSPLNAETIILPHLKAALYEMGDSNA